LEQGKLTGAKPPLEATEIAMAEGCDVVSMREFGWTDAASAAIRIRC